MFPRVKIIIFLKMLGFYYVIIAWEEKKQYSNLFSDYLKVLLRFIFLFPPFNDVIIKMPIIFLISLNNRNNQRIILLLFYF